MSLSNEPRTLSVRTRLTVVAGLCALLAAVPTSQLAYRYASELDLAQRETAALPASLAWQALFAALQAQRTGAMTPSRPDAAAAARAATERVGQAFDGVASALAAGGSVAAVTERHRALQDLQREFAAVADSASRKPFPPTALLPGYRRLVDHAFDEAGVLDVDSGLSQDPDPGARLAIAAGLREAPRVSDALSELGAIALAVAVDDIAAVSGAAARYRTQAGALRFSLAQAARVDHADGPRFAALLDRLDAQRRLVDDMLASAAADVNYPLDKMSATLDEATRQQAALSRELMAMVERQLAQREARLRARAMAVFATVLLGLAGVALVLLRTVRGIVGPVNVIVETTERIAQGDLSQDVPAGRCDELGHVLGAIGAMQDRLRALVRQIQGSSTQIRHAAAEIAAGNADLSLRTERSAADLQRTASEMSRIGRAAMAGSDAVGEATGLATQASGAARTGGNVVASVVSTMHAIQASSHRIAEITGVIDGLAFQTNLLALNAAVEAARAGEHGRGFAVVSAEVRTLAQRSAHAAREIKGLIQASVERVDEGNRLAEDAGLAMNDIVERIGRVTGAMARVADTAQAQSAGFSRVGAAVAGLDGLTQQNSALVEQAAAATQSLREQAQGLHELVGVFRL